MFFGNVDDDAMEFFVGVKFSNHSWNYICGCLVPLRHEKSPKIYVFDHWTNINFYSVWCNNEKPPQSTKKM